MPRIQVLVVEVSDSLDIRIICVNSIHVFAIPLKLNILFYLNLLFILNRAIINTWRSHGCEFKRGRWRQELIIEGGCECQQIDCQCWGWQHANTNLHRQAGRPGPRSCKLRSRRSPGAFRILFSAEKPSGSPKLNRPDF